METDENVEKVEAYTKELEDICNMLKKKHEEAKELLVRAVVNNNNLLMLNHPIYEAKISFKFSLLFLCCLFVCHFGIKIKMYIPSQMRTFIKFRNLLRNWHPRSFKYVEEDHQRDHIKVSCFLVSPGQSCSYEESSQG
ncbi:hypothetical protein ACLB2K_047463 [Fragaria x ananassa]